LPKTNLLKIKGDWAEVVDDCRSTVGKESLGHNPSPLFKKRILIAEHSPIRDIIFKWKWKNIKSWITVHWVRHKWECFVRSQRTDRTGVDRDKLPQDAPVDFTGEANVQSLIDTMRKRLCYQAAPETREYAEDLKAVIADVEPEIGGVLVPNCIYRFGCPEMTTCGVFDRFLTWAVTQGGYSPNAMRDIQNRYDAYHAYLAAKGGQKE
jgi:hypothetical protein